MSQRHDDYHAHIYFSPESRAQAERLRHLATRRFEKGLWIGPLHDAPIGPHTQGMFEIQFGGAILRPLLEWLDFERGELSVLVHEVSGDDPRDHDEGARWLGAPIELDVTKLDPSPTTS